MRLPRWSIHAVFLMTVLIARPAASGASALGPFEAQADIDGPQLPGAASFDGERFTIRAAGANMMGAHDEFHFVWRELKGDFAISARVAFTGPGAQAHRKAGLMARAGLGDGAAYVDATVHGSGPKALQVRRSEGGPTEMLVATPVGGTSAPDNHAAPRTVRLERHGQRFTVTIREEGQEDVRQDLSDANLPARLYVGMFVSAHDLDVIETAVFDQVRLVQNE
jgi:regulation of enolase protein 1 (concanavalin A-like superfamily)